MDTIREFISEHSNGRYILAAGIAASVSVYFIVKRIKGRRSLVACPPDTVLLAQLTRGPWAPSLSPFPLKLETYLRITKIPYVNDFSCQLSSKGKTPFIQFNGEEVADSQFAIEFLNKKFDKDLSSHLSPAERAAAEAIRIMVEESLYWCLAYFRWVADTGLDIIVIPFKIPRITLVMFKRQVRKMLYSQGFGRHTEDELMVILRNNLQVLSDYLGTKKYLTGDSPCVADCAVFGQLAQFLWQNSTVQIQHIMQEFPILVSYCERMKADIWPDWDDCITHYGTRVPTK